ncbi:MAG TPA: phospholipid scramblase-related protein [Fredinandcohnia sp.]|nr:phospholipid scramblase-related protein [Fredinandcohnia sp.]
MYGWAEPIALDVLDQANTLSIRQRVDIAELAIGLEARNRFAIESDGGHRLFAFELGGRFRGWLLRQFLRHMRPFRMEVRDEQNRLFLRFHRPFRFVFHRLEIRDPQDRLLGAVRRRLTWIRRIYVIEDAQGRPVAELFGPIFRPWTFEIRVRGNVEGHIRKRWSGLAKEMFTRADNFQLSFGPHLDPRLRPLCLGATFLIDIVHFERG